MGEKMDQCNLQLFFILIIFGSLIIYSPLNSKGENVSGSDSYDFIEGSLEKLGKIQREVNMHQKKLDEASKQSTLLDYLLTTIAKNPLTTAWNIEGDVKLVFEGNNTLAELTQSSNTNPSMGHLVKFKNENASIEFDVKVIRKTASDELEVTVADFGGPAWGKPPATEILLGKFSLATIYSTKHISIDVSKNKYFMDKAANNAGWDIFGNITFRLKGNAAERTTIRLDNFKVVYFEG
jgi:hypothetical protein